MLKIGNIELKYGLALGPMAGVTDMTYRMLCREQGCELTYTEMVSAKAILYKNKNTNELLEAHEGDRPLAVQLFGSDPEIMADIAMQVAERDIDIIDVNMGCPVPKIVNNGEGSALMKNPSLVYSILSSMTAKVKKPVTVKIRKGFSDDEVNADEVARAAEAAGVAAIAVHGRTRQQYYSGKADWDIIKKVKQSVKIPVIGNGDIFNAIDAKNMYEYTGCDAVMVARGAQGNPWIFSEIRSLMDTGIIPPRPSKQDIKDMMLKHLDLIVSAKGEYIGIRQMRKHIAWYTKGLEGSSRLRDRINYAENVGELKELINNI